MKSVEIKIEVPYPVSVVWQALTQKELLSRWLMRTDFEPTLGKKFRFYGNKNRFWRGYVDCEVVDIKPRKLLQFYWQSVPSQHRTKITYRLEEVKDGTSITATHEGFDNTHGLLSGFFMRLMIQQGLKKEFLKKLPTVLKSLSNK